jgi:hypothetical protein
MRVSGPLAINGAILDLSFADLSAGFWQLGDKLTLLSYTGTPLTGGFVGFDDDTAYTFGAKHWKINYNDTIPGINFAGDATGSHFVTFTVTAIPEPGAGFGLTLLVARLVLIRRRHYYSANVSFPIVTRLG